jgi:two-component system OmpR family sensor kinase
VSRLPIRVRLILPYALAIALVLAAMAFFVYERVGSALLSSVDQSLRAQVQEGQGHVEQGRGLLDRDVAGGVTLAELVRADGSVVQATPARLPTLPSASKRRSALAGRTVWWDARIPGFAGTWRLLAVRVNRNDRPLVLVAARTLATRTDALARLERELVFGGVAALALAILLGYALGVFALRPVEAMRARAAAITASRRGQRLPVPRPRDELARLAETLNEMLARLEGALEHERRFFADASHELRTPLTLLGAELELALRRPRSRVELEEALRSASEDTARLSRLAEDLLLIARSDQGGLPVEPERVSAVWLMHEVASRFATAAREDGRRVSVSEDEDGLVDADPTRIEQALGNLVDNALRYGAGDVRLYARRVDGAVELHVADEGPGFPPAFLPRAFDRFSRADEARATGGTGLGLAIVELIARAHGGSAAVANRDRGADAWIALASRPPAAEAASSSSHPALRT